MKLRLPSLASVVQDAHRNGAIVNRFRVTLDEANRIRQAEAAGGPDAGLRVVLEILRKEKQCN
jgi:hypothetical protein